MKQPTDLQHRILQETDQIPPLPEAVVRIVALLNDPDTEPEQIEEVIRHDQVLVARLLAIVNSPFFGLRRTVNCIRDAVMVLGYQKLRSMVMVSSTSKFLNQDFAVYGHEPRGLWKFSVAAAAAGRVLAGALDEDLQTTEDIFIAALLHDIGKIVLAPHLSKVREQDLRAFDHIEEAERQYLGMTHAEAGGLIAGKWNLPALVYEVVSKRDGDGPFEHERAVRIARLAIAEVRELGIGYMQGRTPVSAHSEEDRNILMLGEDYEAVREGMREAAQAALDGLASIC